MNKAQTPGDSSRSRDGILLLFFALSGLSALIYEVLWLKELGLLFGNTAYAASTTLGAFFLGLSVGGFYWGKKSSVIQSPLRAYALLELGICATALLYLLILNGYYSIYPTLFAVFETQPLLFLAVKFVLASSLLFLPAFFMGGTFPVMGQQFIRGRELLGRSGSLLYALNTAGAAIGALVAGFYLPMIFGFRNSYFLACSINAGIALAVYYMSRSEVQSAKSSAAVSLQSREKSLTKQKWSLSRLVCSIAFLSGFTTLSLEVLWTQMFKQVLQNSVYSFSAVLVTFLISLTTGALIANMLCRIKKSPFAIMTTLMILSAISIYTSPAIFYHLTDGLAEISLPVAWSNYVLSIFGIAALVIFIPCTIMGTIFPYLLKMYQKEAEEAGQTIGRLTAINTIGAILGSICAGFIFSGFVGIWTSIKVMAVIYFIAAAFVMNKITVRRFMARAAVSIVLIVCFSLLVPFSLPVVKVSAEEGEKLYEVWQGTYGTVAVIRKGNDLKIKINNTYDIGGSASVIGQTWQARIPLFLHPDPKKVFFLGMGTGITAGAALDHPVEKVVVCELIPEVVEAARKYFARDVNHLFDDPRVSVIVEDGRNYLLGTKEKYDAIISDLFTPWHAGIGSLYSKEHFRSARTRLNSGGLFAQWLPLAQMSKYEFSIIARTMAEVFPQVTLWRLNTSPDGPIVVLIGQNEIEPLDPGMVERNVQKVLGENAYIIPYIYYVGNISGNSSLFENYPINTENRPVIEYSSPVTKQKAKIGAVNDFIGYEFISFYDELLKALPPEKDPYLKILEKRQYDYIHAGLNLYQVDLFRMTGMSAAARSAYRAYLSHIPINIYPELAQ